MMQNSENALSPEGSLDFLAGGGDMGERIRTMDWSSTPLGPPAGWPASLKISVRIMLASQQPFWVGWGKELTYLYNDPYIKIIGRKHPQALGQPITVVWREIWNDIEPLLATALSGKGGTYVEAKFLIMERHGYPEETYYTFSYSPIPDEDGSVGGIFCANTDDTRRVIGERQMALLREVAARTAGLREWREVCASSMKALEFNRNDLPFAVLYLMELQSRSLMLAGVSGIEGGSRVVPRSMEADDESIWPLRAVHERREMVVVSELARVFGDVPVPTGAWKRPAERAVLLPIVSSGETGRVGVLIVGLNPFRMLDDSYQGFLTLLAGQLSASLGNADAYEQEKRRTEALAELDRAKTTFFSNISHEFRTPLTLMLGPIEEMLSDGGLGPAVREKLQVAQRNSQRLLRLVNSLLDFSRIEAGRVQASYEPTDLRAFTAELASVFRSAIERSGMRLTIDCEAMAEPAYVDREMWEKVVLNLLSNAFKYTLEGEIAVTLRQVGKAAELAVRDTGIGIPAHELPNLFKRFHRIDGQHGRTQEGSGIGLALVQELVKLHGGTVRIESVEGVGSTFFVSIPLGSEHLAADRIRARRPLAFNGAGMSVFMEEALRLLPDQESAPTPLMEEGSHPFSPTRGARVLLADDNADMREYVRKLLEPLWSIESVGDGEAALEAARREVPELIVSDVMMPKLDGFGLLRAVRADPVLRNVPFILLSARAGEESRIEGLEAGADDYLVKPFTARELVARIGSQLQMARVRREATEAIEHRERLFRALVSASSQSVWHFKRDRDHGQSSVHQIDEASATWWREFTGQTENQRLSNGGMGWMESVHPEEQARVRQDWETIVSADHPARTEFRVRRADGQWRRILLQGVPVPDSSGAIHEWAGTVIDVTEQRTAEEAVHHRSLQFETLINQSPLGVYLVDADFRIREVNPIAQPAFATVPGGVIGRDFDEVTHLRWEKRYADEIVAIFRRTLATGEPYLTDERAEFRIDLGVTQYYEWRVDRLTLPDGRFGLVCYFRDISQQVQARVERERLLAAEQKAREEAEQAGRLKDEFLATLSHELRTPLNAILGWSQLLYQQTKGNEELEEGLGVIERNARMQVQLIEDLLDMSRIVSGKLRLDVQRVDIPEVIRAAVEAVRPAAVGKEIRIEVVLDSHVGPVRGDPSRLQQVIWNLLTNAIKFTPRLGKVQVALERVNSHIEITVTDTGLGISPDFLPYVFERFRQADASTTRRHGGLGLGLSIVKNIVEMHGGKVRAKSLGEGKGATFSVEIPLMVVHEEDSSESRHPRSPGKEGEVDEWSDETLLEGVRVLIVDDEPDARELIRRVLNNCKAEVSMAGSAAEGLLVLMRERPNVLLSDIGMPGEDGYSFIRRVRELPEEGGGGTPAAALTAFARSEDRSRAMRAGYQSHIAKPVEPSELVTVVASLAGRMGKPRSS